MSGKYCPSMLIRLVKVGADIPAKVGDGICADHNNRTSPCRCSVGMLDAELVVGGACIADGSSCGHQAGNVKSCRQSPDDTTFNVKWAESGPANVGAVLSSMLIVWLRLALTFPAEVGDGICADHDNRASPTLVPRRYAGR